MNTLDAALEYLDRGWAIIPIRRGEKVPAVKWGKYVDSKTLPSEDEVIGWFTKWPDASVAVLSGELSNLVIVDCDNQAAMDAAESYGLTKSPVRVRTKKGYHYYYSFPEGSDWIKNRAGIVGDGVEWPIIDGLDLRGSKGYCVAPPSANYTWDIVQGHDLDDVPVYVKPIVKKITASNVVDFATWRLEGMSLEHVEVHLPIWERTQKLIDRLGFKLPDGGSNGRDDRLYKYISSLAGSGERGQDLLDGAHRFMEAFFQNPIEKVGEMCERAEANEIRNAGLEAEPVPTYKPSDFKPITTASLDELRAYVDNIKFYIDPIVPTSGTIIQVFGYSGHGKSMFVRNLLYSACSGEQRFGPFDLNARSRVLYFDFENSRANVANFLDRSKRSFGDAGDDFMIWAPFHDERDMNLLTDAGIKNFERWIKSTNPTHIVIDTIRSAFPGLQENSAEQWSYINQLCLKLRNAGLVVWLLHHSNKPSEGTASGREAGSSNQLTVLETQMKVTQVFWDKETAEVKAGLYEGDLPSSPFADIQSSLVPSGERIEVMMQVRFGKVREWSDAHEPVYNIAFVGDPDTETVRIISPRTAKQRAISFAKPWVDASGAPRSPLSDQEISDRVGRGIPTVREWTAELRETLASSRISNS